MIDECLEHDCCDWVLRIVKNGSIEVKAVLDLCLMLKLMYELFGVDGEIIGAFGIMDYSIYSRRNDEISLRHENSPHPRYITSVNVEPLPRTCRSCFIDHFGERIVAF